MKQIIVPLIMFLFLANVIFAADLPIGIQKIQEYQQEQAYHYLQNISFLVAFLGGILSFLLPCSLAILPAFFSYTFKEKKDMTKMTLIFFSGFSIVFILLGIIASFLGQSLATFQVNHRLVVSIAGIFMLIMALFTFFGKGFSSIIKQKSQYSHDGAGIFLFGFFFAVGWSACLGPILAGILLISSTFNSYFLSSMLLFSYSLGIFVPLFLISYFWDTYSLGEKKWLRGKEVTIGKYSFHSWNIVSGILLFIAGLVFLVFSGTAIVQQNITYSTGFIYEVERQLIDFKYGNLLGFLLLIVIVFLVYRVIKRNKNKTA